MTAESVQRVLAYLETIRDPRIKVVIEGYTAEEPRKRASLRIDDLVDLCRRALLLDSLVAENERQGHEIHRLRARLPDEPGIVEE